MNQVCGSLLMIDYLFNMDDLERYEFWFSELDEFLTTVDTNHSTSHQVET